MSSIEEDDGEYMYSEDEDADYADYMDQSVEVSPEASYEYDGELDFSAPEPSSNISRRRVSSLHEILSVMLFGKHMSILLKL